MMIMMRYIYKILVFWDPKIGYIQVPLFHLKWHIFYEIFYSFRRPGVHKFRFNTFCVDECNVCAFALWYVPHVAFLAPRISRRLLYFLEKKKNKNLCPHAIGHFWIPNNFKFERVWRVWWRHSTLTVFSEDWSSSNLVVFRRRRSW
jgi:hypothetical protein